MIRLKTAGVKRVGFLCNHIYMGETLDPELLKGTDRRGYELLKRYSTAVDLVALAKIDGDYYYADLVPLFMKFEPGVWRGVYWDCPDELHYHDQDQGELITTLTDKEECDVEDFEPRLDMDGKYKVVADEYRLGDVLFFKSVGPARLSMCGDSEIHLGNEGFWGSVYNHAAVIAKL
jgi:hypothetical protein